MTGQDLRTMTTPTEKALEQVERLTMETYGRAAAVSVDDEMGKWFIRCWDAKGMKVNEVARASKMDALRAMGSALRLVNATRSSPDEESEPP